MDKAKLMSLLLRAQAERWPANRMESVVDQILKGSTDEVPADKLPPMHDSTSPHFPSFIENAAHRRDMKAPFEETARPLEAQPSHRHSEEPPDDQSADPGLRGTYPKGGRLTPEPDTRPTDRDGRPTNKADQVNYEDHYPPGQEPKINENVVGPDPKKTAEESAQPATRKAADFDKSPTEREDPNQPAQPKHKPTEPERVNKKADDEDHRAPGQKTPASAKAAHPAGQDAPAARPRDSALGKSEKPADLPEKFVSDEKDGMGTPGAKGSPAK